MCNFRTKKQLKQYLLAISALLLVFGCEKSTKDDYLSIEPTELVFSCGGSSSILTIKSNAEWSIMYVPNWLEFSMRSGANSQEVTVTAKANSAGVKRTGSFVVRTNNGSIQHEVNVSQYGNGDGDQFNVADVSKRWLNGDNTTSGGMDSIYIDANMSWSLEGSEWLSATFQGHNVIIDGKTLYSGSGYLKCYSKSRNEEYEDRIGMLRVSSPYSDKTFEIPIAQLGVAHVVLLDPLVLADGYATMLKVGAGVDAIRFKRFEGAATDSEVTVDAANESWAYSKYKETTVIYTSSLKPNTQYELCIKTISSDDYYWSDGLNRFTFTTPSDLNQPLCEMQDFKYSNGKLSYKYVLNSYAAGFYSTNWGTEYDVALLGYTMRNRIRKNEYTLKDRGGSYTLNNVKSNLTFYTWAVDHNMQLSSVISSYPFKLGNGVKSKDRLMSEHIGCADMDEVNCEIEYHK